MPSRKLVPIPISRADLEKAARKEYVTRGRYHPDTGGGDVVAVVKSKAKRSSKRPRSSPSMGSPMTDYMKLVLNPCHGPLVQSVGTVVPGAIVERVRATITLDTSVNDSGYIIFFPSYHGLLGTTGYANGSIFVYTTATPGTPPVNTAATPLGTGTITSAVGAFQVDPISPNLGVGSIFSRAQCLSACVQLDCLAALSTVSGQVAIVSNYSLASLNTNSGVVGGSLQFPSVDGVFAYAATRERLNLDGHEVRWRPSDHQAVPRTRANEEQGKAAAGPIADAVLWSGLAAGTGEETKDVSVDPASVSAICIAWRGVPKATSSHVINLVKVCSLELSARNNAIEQIPTGKSAETVASTIDSVTNSLDRAFRTGWQIGKGIYDISMGAMRLSNNAAAAYKLIENNYAPKLRARTMKSIMNG